MSYHWIILIRKIEKNFTTEQNRKRKKVRSVARFPVRVFFLPCRRDDAPIVVPASFLFPPSCIESTVHQNIYKVWIFIRIWIINQSPLKGLIFDCEIMGSVCCVAVKDRKLPPPCNSSGLTALHNWSQITPSSGESFRQQLWRLLWLCYSFLSWIRSVNLSGSSSWSKMKNTFFFGL